MMWGWDGAGWSWGGAIMSLFMLLFWVAIIVGVVLLVRAIWGQGSRPAEPCERHRAGSPDALRILEDRYARGEIEREEFLRRREDLLSGRRE